MQKIYDLKTVCVNSISINYFYIREKNDINGNPRFRVFIIDPDGPAVYEQIAKTYESLIENYVKTFISEGFYHGKL